MPTVYVHLTGKERYAIDMERKKGLGVRAIAKVLGRSPSTVSRELRRNRTQKNPYDFSGALSRARARRARQNRLRLYREKPLRRYVDRALERGWSPEQISGRLSRQKTLKRISPNAVYRYVRRLAKFGDYRINRFRRCPKKRRKKYVRSSGPFARGNRPLGRRHDRQLRRDPRRPGERGEKNALPYREKDRDFGGRRGHANDDRNLQGRRTPETQEHRSR